MKIRKKIVLLLIPLIVIPLLSIGWFAFERLREISQEKTFSEVDTLIDQIRLHVTSDLETITANIELFSRSDLLHRYLFADQEDRYSLWQRPLLTLFTSYMKAYPDYYEIRILLPDGFEDTRTSLEQSPNRYSSESNLDYFQTIQNSHLIVATMLYDNPDNDETSLLAYKKLILNDPAIEMERSLRAYLLITIRPSYMIEQLNNNTLNEKGWIAFTDAQGRFLFQTQTKESVNKTLWAKLKQDNDSRKFVRAIYQGEYYYFKRQKLSSELYLMTALSEQELYSESHQLRIVVGLVVIISIIFTGSLFYILLSWILINPLNALKLATQQISHEFQKQEYHKNLNDSAENSLNTSAKVRKDEIGDLSRSFNSMSHKLQKMYQELESTNVKLEQKVAERTIELQKSLTEIEQKNRLLNEQSELLAEMARIDSLTNIANRRYFDEVLEKEWARNQRAKTPLSIAMIDIDYFKQFNDSYGHAKGDDCLKEVANAINLACQRAGDFVARYGGEEFIVIMSGSEQKSALTVLNKIQQKIQDLAIPHQSSQVNENITLSIGLSTLVPNDGNEPYDLVNKADALLYTAKQNGRNRIEI